MSGGLASRLRRSLPADRGGALRALSRTKRWSPAGYTLVEILAVVAILTILMALFIVGLGKYRQNAYEKGTHALITSIRAAVEAYHGEFREYPPDGLDFDVILQGGTRLKGSAALVYFIGTPMLKETQSGEDIRKVTVGPFIEIKESMVSGSGELDQRLGRPGTEFIDAWGNPIHYDNVTRDPQTNLPRISDQSSASAHTMTEFNAETMHGPDPRRREGGGIDSKNVGQYDLWSHGSDVKDPRDDITNWGE